MNDLTPQEMEATRGGFLNTRITNIAATIGNTATSVNVGLLTGSGNLSLGGATIAQEAAAAAGNISL